MWDTSHFTFYPRICLFIWFIVFVKHINKNTIFKVTIWSNGMINRDFFDKIWKFFNGWSFFLKFGHGVKNLELSDYRYLFNRSIKFWLKRNKINPRTNHRTIIVFSVPIKSVFTRLIFTWGDIFYRLSDSIINNDI